MRKLLALTALAMLVATSAAFALEKGDGLYALQITNGIADLYYPGGPADHGISASSHSEIGVGVQYWRLMSADYAFTFSAGIGTFAETDKPGTGAASGATDFKYTQSSWSVRVGGDRVAKVGDRTVLYFGPGVEYWTGKSKFDGGGYTTTYESENISRIGLSGRIGGMMMLTDKVGFNCQLGRYLAYASAEEKGAKATWWPSGFQGAGGIVFSF